MQYTKLVVGLTGGIGSGKSTVAKYFADLGAEIIDTDKLARSLTQPGQAAYESIVKKYGAKILLPDQKLNRRALREIIFEDATQRVWLEKLLHPLIRAESQRLAAESNAPYCMIVIPLLFESAPNVFIKRILVVDAPETLQVERTCVRDNLNALQVDIVMQTQVSREQRLNGADDIIYNDKGPENLMPQVLKLHELYLSISLKG
jgi:dephospho-CoA kinase